MSSFRSVVGGGLRLNIGPRLISVFVLIILLMLAGDAIVLWQFHVVRLQAERLNGLDQELAAVLRVHARLLAFHDRLEEIANYEDSQHLIDEAGSLNNAVLEDTERAKIILSKLPSSVEPDPTILPTLEVIQRALQTQIEAITNLATLREWGAVRLRLANQVRPLEFLASSLVEKVDREVSEEQAQAAHNIRRVQRRVFLMVPLTVIFTLLIAGSLGLMITRSITKPLARLVEGSRKLAQGDFQHQVPVEGQDELADLSQVFNDTAQQLQDRKRAEEELRQAQADLAHVNRVTTMGELSASLAHEVNQPITGAVINAQACLRWLKRDQPDVAEAREAASRIIRDVNRAAEIIKRIRLYFRKGTLLREPLDINEIIQELIVLLGTEANRHMISITTELGENLPTVAGDRVHLQQVLMNLIINSIDAMKTIDGVRQLVIRSQQVEDEQLLVSVDDTGIGLPAQQVDQIFNAFFTTKAKGQGTGMGLRISRTIIESHGGRLWAVDNHPRGASFRFTLASKASVS